MHRQTTEIRFWSKVEKRGPDECWLWIGYRDKHGYGRMMFRGKVYSAHRLAYLLTFGDFDESLDACHRCDNPPCCNPSHTFLGTAKDNVQDAIAKGRFCKGSTNGKSKLTEELVRKIREAYPHRGTNMRDFAKQFGISKSGLHFLLARRTWKHVI